MALLFYFRKMANLVFIFIMGACSRVTRVTSKSRVFSRAAGIFRLTGSVLKGLGHAILGSFF